MRRLKMSTSPVTKFVIESASIAKPVILGGGLATRAVMRPKQPSQPPSIAQ
jgi:hypothetical protein